MKKILFLFAAALLAAVHGASAQAPSFVKTMETLDWSLSEAAFAKAFPAGKGGARESIVVRDEPHTLHPMSAMRLGKLTLLPLAIFHDGVLDEVEAQVPAEGLSLSEAAAATATLLEAETGRKGAYDADGDIYIFIIPGCTVIVADDVIFVRRRDDGIGEGVTLKLKAGE